MHLSEYWELTIGDLYDCIDGYKDRIETTLKIQDSLNYLLGQYVAYGVHASKKNPYPKQPFLAGKTNNTEGFKTDSALDAYILARAKKGEK